MNIPEEYELLSIFESEPQYLEDPENIPFYYNRLKWEIENEMAEKVRFILLPAEDTVNITVCRKGKQIANLSFSSVRELKILSDSKTESRIMVTIDNAVVKFDLKPEFSITYQEELSS